MPVSSKLQLVLVPWETSLQVKPPSLLIWIFSSTASASLLPETISVVSLVLKSPAVPVSWSIAVIDTVAEETLVSMVTAWLSLLPMLAAASITRAR